MVMSSCSPLDAERLSELARFPRRVLTPHRSPGLLVLFYDGSRQWRPTSIWESVQLESGFFFFSLWDGRCVESFHLQPATVILETSILASAQSSL